MKKKKLIKVVQGNKNHIICESMMRTDKTSMLDENQLYNIHKEAFRTRNLSRKYLYQINYTTSL